MRPLLLALALSTSVGTRAQTVRPITPGEVLTVDVVAGETVLLDVTDHAFNPGGYYGMRLIVRSPSDEQLFVSPMYVFNTDPGRTAYRIADAEPGTWAVSVDGGEGVQIEGALWATATPPALTVHEAAAAGDIDALRAAIPAGEMERPDLDYQTALMLAASGGHAGAVRVLLDAGANLHATAGTLEEAAEIDPEYEIEMSVSTALHFAAASGDAETVRVLLDAGADPNARAFGGGTTLHSAVFGSSEVLRLLLDAGTDPALASEYQGTPADLVRDRIATVERIVARSGDSPENDDARAKLTEMLAVLED